MTPLGKAVATVAVVTMVAVPVSGGVAGAVDPPVAPPGAGAPPDPPPGPDQPMHQVAPCTITGALPGSDLRGLPAALQLLDMPTAWNISTGAGVVVGVIDTGVVPQPRLPHLVAGGDWVMGKYGDGLSDCDGHGTMVASLIGAAPAAERLPAQPAGAAPAAPPPAAPAPVPIPPPPPPPTVTVTQTTTVKPPPPPPPPPPAPAPPPAPQDGPPPDAPAWVHTASTATGRLPQLPLAPAGEGPDGLIGIAPDAVVVAARQTAQTFGLVDPGITDNPEDVRRAGDIHSLARAIVHLANLGVRVINISVMSCISVSKPQDQNELAAAVRYAAVDRDVVIVAAAGNAGAQGCSQNPDPVPADTADPLGKESVVTIATPAWFSDFVVAVSATDNLGVPLTGQSASLHGPWVGLAAPGDDMVGLGTDGQVINGSVNENGKMEPLKGSSFSSAIVAGIAVLVRAKFPNLSAHQVIHRLEATAHPPAGGRDTVVGFGVVDPVAALTWDVPPGDWLAPGVQREPLHLPAGAPPADPRPAGTAAAIAGALLVGLGLLTWWRTVNSRREQQR